MTIKNSTQPLRMRKMNRSDLRDATLICTDAFGIPKVGPHIDLFNLLHETYFSSWFILHEGKKPVAIAATFDYANSIYIGYMCVSPDFQKNGYAQLMMSTIIKNAKGKTILLDASEEGHPLYTKLGFSEVDNSRLFLLEKLSSMPKVQSISRITNITADDYHKVINFEQELLGANREKLLLALFERFGERSYLALNEKNEVTGFAVAQWKNIGPFLATTPTVATELLSQISMLHFDSPPSVIFPTSNKSSAAVLEKWGTYKKDCVHMVLGDDGPFKNRELIYGQVSYATG